MMRTPFFATLTLAGVAAAAIALAPAAAASGTLDCEDSGLSSVCQKAGHAAIVATPGSTTSGSSGYWPFGAGPTPPIWALD